MNKDALKIIEFFTAENLNEIIAEKPCNYFALEDKQISNNKPQKLLAIQDKNLVIHDQATNIVQTQKIIQSSAFQLRSISSTSEALSFLAKKHQNNSYEVNMENKSQILLSINEIINQAKDIASKAANLQELRKVVGNFEGCNLKKMATNTVFSDGNPESKIMVIGEAPGNNEDLQGIPFCGDSGKLLDEMFKSIGLDRTKFYITNSIFWRPPGNRRPTEEELAICRPFVERHIQLVSPKLIILVGATAMSAILNDSTPISKIRGEFKDFAPNYLAQKIKSLVIFHPSYLLRQPSKKKIAWYDMLKIQEFLNL